MNEEEKEKGELGFQVVRESRLETLPNSIFVCFGVVLGYFSRCIVVWIGVEEFLYKGNVGFLGEMLSKFSKTHVFVLAITCSSLIQIE